MKPVDEIIKTAAEKYGIDLERPEKYDITNPKIARGVDRDIAEYMYPIVKMWDEIEARSWAGSRNIWVCAA